MTLTEMLAKEVKNTEPVKDVIKLWLGEVGLPTYKTLDKDYDLFDATKSIRDLLVILVDEL